MSYFDYWMENVRSTSKLIADPTVFKRVWVQREPNVTSVLNVDELLEQLLGDLQLEENVTRFANELRAHGVFEPFSSLTKALVDLEKAILLDPQLRNPEKLLSSQSWETLKLAAEQVR